MKKESGLQLLRGIIAKNEVFHTDKTEQRFEKMMSIEHPYFFQERFRRHLWWEETFPSTSWVSISSVSFQTKHVSSGCTKNTLQLRFNIRDRLKFERADV